MRRSDVLTGGTKDVNPQFLSNSVTQSGADTTTSTQIQLPIQRLPSGKKAQVMELLKVMYIISTGLSEVDSTVEVYLSTKNFATTATTWSEPTVFSGFRQEVKLTTSGQITNQLPWTHDLTDGAGHGVIIATDSIYAQCISAGTGATNTCKFKLLYRWKDVGLAEYIGVVQSQQ